MNLGKPSDLTMPLDERVSEVSPSNSSSYMMMKIKLT